MFIAAAGSSLDSKGVSSWTTVLHISFSLTGSRHAKFWHGSQCHFCIMAVQYGTKATISFINDCSKSPVAVSQRASIWGLSLLEWGTQDSIFTPPAEAQWIAESCTTSAAADDPCALFHIKSTSPLHFHLSSSLVAITQT